MSRLLFAIAVLALLCLPLGLAIWRSNQLFVLQVSAGKVRFLRGRMPQSLLDQMVQVLASTHAEGTLVCVTEQQRPRLLVRGDFPPGLVQQLRNIVGLYPLARIRAGGRPRGH